MRKPCLAVTGIAVAAAGILAGQTRSALPVLTLDQAIQEAIANNLSLAAEKHNISVAEAREITARLRPNPVVTASGQTLNLFGATLGPDSPLGPNVLNLHTDFPIELGHKRQARTELARQERSLAELGVRETMRQVIASVQNGWVGVLEAVEKLKLAQENMKSMENLVAINEARMRSGDLAQVELDRSRVAALQYGAAVEQARLRLDQAKVDLSLALGRKTERTDFEVAGQLRHDALATSKEELKRLALRQRPDYLGQQRSQARSRADLELQIANSKPDISLGTEFTRQSAYGVSGNMMGFSFSMPLQVFNRNQGEIARAQREIAQSGAKTAALRASIEAEVEKAYQQYNVFQKLLALVESRMLAKARSVRDVTEYSYRRGEASLVEFLDAQRALNDAMETYIDARANYARSLYLIETVSGATVSHP